MLDLSKWLDKNPQFLQVFLSTDHFITSENGATCFLCENLLEKLLCFLICVVEKKNIVILNQKRMFEYPGLGRWNEPSAEDF